MWFAYHLVLGPVSEEPRGGEVGGAPHQLLYNNPPLSLNTLYTVKKGWRISRPQPGCHVLYQTIPGRE
jgi:hypothetical protein